MSGYYEWAETLEASSRLRGATCGNAVSGRTAFRPGYLQARAGSSSHVAIAGPSAVRGMRTQRKIASILRDGTAPLFPAPQVVGTEMEMGYN